MTITAAVVSRIFIGELPYVISYLDYYLSIGFSRFYLIINDKNEEAPIKNYLKKYEKQITYFIPQKDIKDLNYEGFRGCESLIQENYILNVDIDEFLYLKLEDKVYINIQDFIGEHQYEKYKFDWLMVINDGISNKERGFVRPDVGKIMVKTSCGLARFKCHDIFTNKKNLKTFQGNMYVLHYWGRTFNDIVIKCLYGKLPNNKTTNLDEMNLDVRKKRLPVRFKLMALLSIGKKDIKIPNFVINKIDFNKENELVTVFDKIGDLQEIYREYVSKLNYKFFKKYIEENIKLLDMQKIID